LDAPIAIRALKRFVTERFGVEDRIAIIGAGPAGLAAAHDLALRGYPVTIFEAQPVAGGMLRLGIPEYRLPRELIKLEVNAILSLGVDLRVGQRLGKDFSLGDLKEQGYRAIFVAIGSHRSRDLEIPGIDLDGVLKGVDFLLNVNMGYRRNSERRCWLSVAETSP
jgi:NADH-quinone oxidoreductase subunit F